ncbi:MAG: hypothetical protein OEL76_17390 [Siculibacillus sp.]|nr:hypothetical protein [Siculibacillus sp.]
MSRILLLLFVTLGWVAFAAPATAHVHGGGHGGAHAAAPIVAARPALPVATGIARAAEIRADTAVADQERAAPCGGDCDHSGAAGCLCMAACLALAEPDLPNLAPPVVPAGPSPRDAAPWRPTALVPPTPPPRLL